MVSSIAGVIGPISACCGSSATPGCPRHVTISKLRQTKRPGERGQRAHGIAEAGVLHHRDAAPAVALARRAERDARDQRDRIALVRHRHVVQRLVLQHVVDERREDRSTARRHTSRSRARAPPRRNGALRSRAALRDAASGSLPNGVCACAKSTARRKSSRSFTPRQWPCTYSTSIRSPASISAFSSAGMSSVSKSGALPQLRRARLASAQRRCAAHVQQADPAALRRSRLCPPPTMLVLARPRAPARPACRTAPRSSAREQ